MPPKPNLSRTGNGRMITVKQLNKRAYNAIHRLPLGTRGDAMKTLLEALAVFLAKPGAQEALLSKNIAIVDTTPPKIRVEATPLQLD